MSDVLYLTKGAIDAYCRRNRFDAADLEASLREMASRAVPTGRRTRVGHEVWESSGVKFLVIRSPTGRALADSIVPVLEVVTNVEEN